MRRAVVVIALLSMSVLAGAVPAADVTDDPESASSPILAPSEDFDRVRFEIRVFRNGSARWTFTYMRYLPDNESVQQFRTYADRFESEETDLYTDFRGRAATLARIGRNQTGRSMAAEAFSRRAYVDRGINDVGVVELSFRWTAFAQVEGPRVVVGDVFEGGLFIGPDQSLVIKPGSGLIFESIAPNGTLSGSTLAESDSVTWRGQREFSDERPRVVFVDRSAVGGTTTGSETVTSPGTGSGTGAQGGGTAGGGDTTPRRSTAQADGADGGSSLVLVFAGALLVIVGIVGGLAYRRSDTETAKPDDGSEAATPAVPETDADDVVVPEDAVLSDEERVVELLEANGGRMRQVNIVDETEWSKSKVSMLLSDMEDAGTISKLRVGRENIVSLAGHEPEAAGSPFEYFDEPDPDDGEE